MAKTVDFDKAIKKNNEECKAREEMRPEELVVPELKDGVKAVDPNTGDAGEQNTPRDPNVPPPNTNGGNGGGTVPPNGNNGNGGGTVPPNGNTVNTGGTVPPNGNNGNVGGQAPIPQRPQQPLVSKDEFKGKAKSFFSADVPKGFWSTLEDKIDKMMSGNTAEDIAQNMFFGAIDLFFDMIGNAIDHHRKDKQRQDEEYMKNKEAYEKEVGVSDRHKKVMVIMALAKRRGLTPDSVVTEEDKKAMYKDLKSKDLLQDVADMYQAATGTECTKAEAKKLLESFGKSSIKSQVDLKSQLRGIKLNDPMFKHIGEKGTRATALKVHADYQTYGDREDQLEIDKEAMRKYKVDQAQAQFGQQQQQGPTPQQQQGQTPQQQGGGRI